MTKNEMRAALLQKLAKETPQKVAAQLGNFERMSFESSKDFESYLKEFDTIQRQKATSAELDNIVNQIM